jgi:hypothetical protein
MNARTLAPLLVGLVLLVSCSPANGDEEAEAAAQGVLTEYLHATASGDWDHVYELTTADARPAERTQWVQRRRERGFVHKCVGETTGRPAIELETLTHDQGSALIQAILWVQSDQGRVCRWRLTADPDGQWRVAALVPHDQVEQAGSS